MPDPVLDGRRADYDQAAKACRAMSARWIEAKSGGKMTPALDHEMDYALDEFRRAKNRLERAERKAS